MALKMQPGRARNILPIYIVLPPFGLSCGSSCVRYFPHLSILPPFGLSCVSSYAITLPHLSILPPFGQSCGSSCVRYLPHLSILPPFGLSCVSSYARTLRHLSYIQHGHTRNSLFLLTSLRYYNNGSDYGSDIDSSGDNSSKERERVQTLSLFWKSFESKVSDSISSEKKSSNATIYHSEVIKLLINSKSMKNGESFTQDELFYLQNEIEEMTMKFDEISVFKSVPNLLKLLINNDMITAKRYLIQKCGLSKKDLTSLKVFGKYTLEAIIINVLGSVFNCVQDLSLVRVSTLIEQIDSIVRVQAVNMGVDKAAGMNNVNSPLNKGKQRKQRKVTRSDYAIGVGLVEFLVERNLIKLITDESYTEKVVFNQKGYIDSNCYAMCNFEFSLLPVKLNLPMVYEPLPWKSKVDVPSTLADIEGGYLSGLTPEIYHRFRLLTSRDYSHFYIKLKSPKRMCDVLNKLQSQAFEINSKVLCFILDHRDTLEEVGLLVNRNLAKVNLYDALDLLRSCYFNNLSGVMRVCGCHVLVTELLKRVQQARYEEFILILASAYRGYQFYLPAFVDFRGRIYRAGVLHFHERDLARSLLVFASDAKAPEQSMCDESGLRLHLACAAALKYKKFVSLNDAYNWYQDSINQMIKSDDSFINFAKEASDPFQFLAKVLYNERVSDDLERLRGFNSVPVTQDASASAYQIMSYLLLNAEMGRKTNLLPSPEKEIQDLYLSLRSELLEFLHPRFDKDKYQIIESRFTRKFVKQLFMPLIYGKTVISMASDIRDCFGSLLRAKYHYQIAKLCHDFWVNKYPDIANLMRMINLIGWFCSVLDQPVLYSIPYFTTVQDYMRRDTTYIWLYDRVTKKKHKLNFQVPTLDRDKRKTKVATCVNFIHQKDAFIAMEVVDKLRTMKAPVYTVHDNFITTSVYAAFVPQIYTKVFMEMGSPLRIINEFIQINLIRPTKGELLNEPYWGSDPISGEFIRTILISLEPNSRSSKDKLKWSKNIDSIVSCYEEYVNTVCGGMHHVEKWYEFYLLLNSWDSAGFNYSVHY